MAAIQYRPIDAPDFSSAMRGYQMFSDQLNNAFAAARGTLNDLQARQTQTADQEVLARALQQQDAGGLRDALASGSLLSGINPNRLSAGVLAGLQDRVGTLLGQDRTRQQLEAGSFGLERDRYGFGRTVDADQRSDAARTAQAALFDAASRGNSAEVARIRQENADVLGNLNADQSLAMAQGAQGLLRGELGQRQGEFGLARDRYNLSIDQRNDNESRAAQVLATDVLRRAATPEDARAVLESMSGLDQNLRAQATRLVQSAFPGTYGPIASAAPAAGGGRSSGGGASAPGTAGTQNGNVYDTTYQFQATPVPISQMKIGDVIDHQSGMIARQGHSPLGAFQINKATLEDFGPRVLGKDWKNQPFDAEAQNKIGEAIFNARKGGDLTQTWAALTDKRPGAYKDLSWDEMRQQISRAETGQAVGNQGRQATGEALSSILTRAMQDTNNGGVSNDYAQTVGDTRDAGQVIAEITGEGGSFAGADKAILTRELRRVMNEGNVNAATAAAVLRRNIDASPTNPLEYLQYGANRVLSPFRSTGNLGNGLRLNDDGVDAAIQSFRNGSALSQFDSAQQVGAVAQQIQQAQATLDDAVAQYRAIAQRAQTQPGLAAQLPRYQARVQAAQERLNAVREAQRGLEQLRPNWQDRTVPQPVAQSQGGGSARTTQILQEAATPLPSGIPAPGFRGQGRNW